MRAIKGDPLPEGCPECGDGAPEHDIEREHAEGEARIAKMVEEGRAPAIGGTPIAKAGKMAEKIMSESGMTDMNDSGRRGDRAAKPPSPMQSREIQEITREMVEMKAVSPAAADQFAQGAQSFWQTPNKKGAKKIITPNGMPSITPGNAAQAMQAGAMGAREARAAGVDPIELLHKSPDRRMRLDVVGKASK